MTVPTRLILILKALRFGNEVCFKTKIFVEKYYVNDCLKNFNDMLIFIRLKRLTPSIHKKSFHYGGKYYTQP